MRVAVIGAGGVGGFLGSLLARAGHDVACLARGAHLEAIQAHGLSLRSTQFGDFTVQVRASAAASELGTNDLVLVAVKMYDFGPAAEAAREVLDEAGMAMTIQNGLEAPGELARVVGPERVLTGTASIEAAIIEPGVVGHLVPMHSVTVSETDAPVSHRVQALVDRLQAAGVNAAAVADGNRALWQKACGLIPFATITAAGDCTLGEFASQPPARELAHTLVDEAVALAAACGYDVRQAADGWRGFIDNGPKTAPGFTSSLNRDFRAGKRTELEWLTGKFVRLGQEKRVPTPAHRALYGLLKLREAKASTPPQ
ncbi:MAG TPA: 2-dehydropantoate 2-reductase [Chloroflexota bacterium]